ncbi:MAG: DUF948 domain-containing protein [Desulfuromonadaceae bacterium]|nr:DUF948 domain-containing protein [Desulfuromonadaceae bacterium]
MVAQVDMISLGFLIVLIILVIFLLPTIWQIKKTSQEVGVFLGELRRDLAPTLKNLRELTEQATQMTERIEANADKTENLLETLNEIALSVRHVSDFVRQDMSRYAEIAGYMVLGVKAASKVFSKTNKEKESKL